MSSLTIELPSREEQVPFNLRRWAELVEDPVLAAFEGRVETDRHGQVIKSPPAEFRHGFYQGQVGILLHALLFGGRAVTACPISTRDGVKVADVAWISDARLAAIGENICLPCAPEICVEVLSPTDSGEAMAERTALYFAAGATEVWFCDPAGKMTFFTGKASAGETASHLCPQFPSEVRL